MNKLVEEIDKKHVNKNDFVFGNREPRNEQEDLYLRILKACPSLKLDNKEDIEQKVKLGHLFLGGLTSCDFYLKEQDLIIEFD